MTMIEELGEIEEPMIPPFKKMMPYFADHVSTNLRIDDWVEEYIYQAIWRAPYGSLGLQFLTQSIMNEYKTPHAWKHITPQIRLKIIKKKLAQMVKDGILIVRRDISRVGQPTNGEHVSLRRDLYNKPYHSKDWRWNPMEASVMSAIKRIHYYISFAMASPDDAMGFTRYLVYLIKTIQEEKVYDGLAENFDAAKSFLQSNGIRLENLIASNKMANLQKWPNLKSAAKQFRDLIMSEPSVKAGAQIGLNGAQKIIFDAAMTYLNNGSLRALSTIGTKISTLKDPNLSRLFNVEVKQKEGMNEGAAIKILKKYSGDDLILGPQETKALSDAKDGRYDEYRDARDFLRNKLREQVANIIRTSGEEIDGELLMSIADLRKAIPAPYNKLLPKGIDKLKLNDRYELFSPEGKAVASGGKAYQPVIGVEYKLSKDFAKSKRANPAYLHYLNNVGAMTPLYLVELKQKTQTKRQEQAGDIMTNLPSIKKKVIADLDSEDESTRRLATITALMLFLASRVGSLGNKTGDEETYGTSTLLRRHISKKGTDIEIKYIGKSGMNQVQVLNPEVVGNKETWEKIKNNIVKYWKAAEGPTSYLFAEVDGKPPSNSEINKYFKSKGAAGTVHKIRHAIANYYFNEFKPTTQFTDQKKAFAAFKDTMTKVGEKLGHKKSTSDGEEVNVWQTAAKSYVDKSVQKQFFDDNKLMVPKLLEAMWV